MPYSELAQTDKARELESDKTGYYDLEWRTVDEILHDLEAHGIDTADFNGRVDQCKENLSPDVRAGKIDVNCLDEEAQYLTLLAYNFRLRPGNQVKMRIKVYYGVGVNVDGFLK